LLARQAVQNGWRQQGVCGTQAYAWRGQGQRFGAWQGCEVVFKQRMPLQFGWSSQWHLGSSESFHG
jgi:hypothetical protein